MVWLTVAGAIRGFFREPYPMSPAPRLEAGHVIVGNVSQQDVRAEKLNQ